MIKLEIRFEPAHIEHFSLEVVILRSDNFEVIFKNYLENETVKKRFKRFDDVTDYVKKYYQYFDDDFEHFWIALCSYRVNMNDIPRKGK